MDHIIHLPTGTELVKGNQQGLTNYSKSFEVIPQLSKDENQLLEIKYISKPLGSLPEVNLILAVKTLLLKIHVIAGWTVPEKELKTILEDQLIKKIKESYSTLNSDEVEYAFRQNFVQDYGKNMNLALIDQVLNDYLEKRSCVSYAEERYRVKQIEAPKEDPMTDEEFVELNKNIFIKSKQFQLISPRCYHILKIKLTEDQKEEIKKKVRAIFFAIENKEYTTLLSHQEVEIRINQNCKRWAVAEYFNL